MNTETRNLPAIAGGIEKFQAVGDYVSVDAMLGTQLTILTDTGEKQIRKAGQGCRFGAPYHFLMISSDVASDVVRVSYGFGVVTPSDYMRQMQGQFLVGVSGLNPSAQVYPFIGGMLQHTGGGTYSVKSFISKDGEALLTQLYPAWGMFTLTGPNDSDGAVCAGKALGRFKIKKDASWTAGRIAVVDAYLGETIALFDQYGKQVNNPIILADFAPGANELWRRCDLSAFIDQQFVTDGVFDGVDTEVWYINGPMPSSIPLIVP
jgi:hypothetical protein